MAQRTLALPLLVWPRAALSQLAVASQCCEHECHNAQRRHEHRHGTVHVFSSVCSVACTQRSPTRRLAWRATRRCSWFLDRHNKRLQSVKVAQAVASLIWVEALNAFEGVLGRWVAVEPDRELCGATAVALKGICHADVCHAGGGGRGAHRSIEGVVESDDLFCFIRVDTKCTVARVWLETAYRLWMLWHSAGLRVKLLLCMQVRHVPVQLLLAHMMYGVRPVQAPVTCTCCDSSEHYSKAWSVMHA